MNLAGFSHVALTVSDMSVSKEFYSQTLGLAVLDAHESYCALLVGGEGMTALILTSHQDGSRERFSELRPGLDHVSLAVPDVESLDAWQARLDDHEVGFDRRRSEWGHHVNFRDPDGIAVELVVLQPDAETAEIIRRAGA